MARPAPIHDTERPRQPLHLTYPSLLPYALADWDTPDDYLPVTGDLDESMRIPLPPPAWDGHTTGRN